MARSKCVAGGVVRCTTSTLRLGQEPIEIGELPMTPNRAQNCLAINGSRSRGGDDLAAVDAARSGSMGVGNLAAADDGDLKHWRPSDSSRNIAAGPRPSRFLVPSRCASSVWRWSTAWVPRAHASSGG